MATDIRGNFKGMKGHTKYNIGYEVWFMHDNSVKSARIIKIEAVIEKDMNGGAFVQNTWYNLYNYLSPYIECRLFPTKEELLKSL